MLPPLLLLPFQLLHLSSGPIANPEERDCSFQWPLTVLQVSVSNWRRKLQFLLNSRRTAVWTWCARRTPVCGPLLCGCASALRRPVSAARQCWSFAVCDASHASLSAIGQIWANFAQWPLGLSVAREPRRSAENTCTIARTIARTSTQLVRANHRALETTHDRTNK